MGITQKISKILIKSSDLWTCNLVYHLIYLRNTVHNSTDYFTMAYWAILGIDNLEIYCTLKKVGPSWLKVVLLRTSLSLLF